MNPAKRHSAAFTLVELLAVMAILAVLIALLMPALDRARRAAYGSHCRSNLRQIGQAMLSYAADQDGLLPFYGEPEGFGWPRGSRNLSPDIVRHSHGTQWDVQIMPYLGINWEWGVTTPPADLPRNRPTVFYCPGGYPYRSLPLSRSQSYNYNARVGQNVRGSRRLAQLEDAERTFLVGDAHVIASYTDYECWAATWLGRQHAGIVRFQETMPQYICYHRHNDRIQLVFAAGHVDARPRSPVTTIRDGIEYRAFPAGARFGNGYGVYPWP